MSPMVLGAYGLIGWGVYRLLFKKSPVSTQATPVIPSIIKPTAAPVAQPTTVASSANIAALQSRLNALGANPPLVVDGISGPKTIAAIQAFQIANGITPDGIVGPITQAALDRGGAAPVPTAAPIQTMTTQSFTPVETIPSTGVVQTVETWADEPEQSLVDHF